MKIRKKERRSPGINGWSRKIYMELPGPTEEDFVSDQERMLMYGKEASNRKQEIDRQHYTIPNQRPKDKHCGKI